MQRARAFFYVCAGVFLLALSYHLGARSAVAQAPGNPAVGISTGADNYVYAITQSGAVYRSAFNAPPDWQPYGNIFSGPTPAQRESFGAVKSRYRGERGAAQPTRDR